MPKTESTVEALPSVSRDAGRAAPPAAPRRARRLYRLTLGSTWLPNVAAIVAVIGIWELAVTLLHERAYVFPSPVRVASEMWRLHNLIIYDTKSTLISVGLSFAISAGIGVPLAILISQWRVADVLLSPILVLSQSVPKVAIAPILAIWFGLGTRSTVAVGATIALFPIVVNIASGLKNVDRELLRLGRSMGASPLQLFTRIKLPSALPSVFVAIKLGIVFAVIGAVVGEFVAGSSGLGYMIELETGQVQTAAAFAGIVVLSALAMALYYLIDIWERLTITWLPSHDVLMTT